MFCTSCGYKIPEANKFCNNCGSPMPGQQPVVQKYKQYQPRPVVPISEQIKPLLDFLKRWKWILITLVLLVTGSLIVYKVFFEPKPEADALVILKEQCKCYLNYDDEMNAVLKDYNDKFSNTAYTSRNSAIQDLNNRKQSVFNALSQCSNAAENHKELLRARYNKNYNKQEKFDNRINVGWALECTRSNENKVAVLESQANLLIESIREPEPDESTLKGKLLGNNVPGWHFESLSEFESITIKNRIRSGDQLEYVVDLTVADASRKNVYTYNNATISFSLSGDGVWALQNISTREYSWAITVGNTWHKIQLPANVTYRLNSNGKRGWVKDDGWFNRNYKLGPDGDQLSLNTSTIFIASREANEDIVITLTITAK